jgi:RHS repeat-associated protein
MSTYRGGTGWDASTWPSSPGTADTTTWAYDAATGTLTSKTDAASHAVAYTYNTRGQLATRTWARGTVATYSYSSTTAEQTGISYSDSTPAIAYTYNRMGQTATVADVTGTRTFAYSTTTTALTSETLPSYFDSRVLTRKYDTTTTGALGRNVGFTLSGASGSGTDSDVSYGYDATGRFSGLSTPSSGPSFTYGFTTNSNLVASITDTSGWTETNTYEAHRNLLTGINGQYGTTSKAQFAYTHDALGRRATVVDSGEIFARYVNSGLATHYTYNDRSEVTGAQSYYGTSATDTSYPVAARGFNYAFDNIGSRTSSSVIGADASDVQTTTYANNNLNQVTSRTSPASVNVTGLAPTAATVTVNSAAVTRQGDYYYKNVTSGSTPAWLSLAASSSLGGSTTRYSYLAATPESYTYDADGNLTDDGRWHYIWDAENRLVSMETSLATSVLSTGVPRQFIQFQYDYLGRRVRKTVANWNGSAYVAALDRKFIYNGWNLVAEYNAPSSGAWPLAVSYVWGLDLSGNLTDGGGVGGLLAIKDASSGAVHLPFYDANGNLHALVNRADGTVTAAYEYNPFGETLRSTGTYAATNSFRFSTKYTDVETQFIYYGYRYYNPSLGRWLGRDPLEEKGGLHLYAFVQNNPVNAWDALGKFTVNDQYGGIPDSDVFVQMHQGWEQIDSDTWYDPAADVRYVYHEGADPSNDTGYNYHPEDYAAPSLGATLMANDDADLAAWRQSTQSYSDGFLNYVANQAAIDAAKAAASQQNTQNSNGAKGLPGGGPLLAANTSDLQTLAALGALPSQNKNSADATTAAPGSVNSAGDPKSTVTVAAAGMVTPVTGILPETTGGVSVLAKIGGWIAEGFTAVADVAAMPLAFLFTPTKVGDDTIHPTFDPSTGQYVTPTVWNAQTTYVGGGWSAPTKDFHDIKDAVLGAVGAGNPNVMVINGQIVLVGAPNGPYKNATPVPTGLNPSNYFNSPGGNKNNSGNGGG